LKAVRGSDVDCSAATCQETCKCSLSECSDKVDACLGDSECAKVQDCAFACACGDEACALECAKKSSSPLALPLFECVTEKCPSSFLKAVRGSDVDCSAATCQDSCECSLNECSDKVADCLADSECAKVQDCAFACACGDEACALECAQKSPSALALPLFECVTGKCSKSFLKALPKYDADCSTATCSETCECSLKECPDQISDCLGDAECAKVQGCAFACPCGDEACALECAKMSSSAFALPAFECVQQKCVRDFRDISVRSVDCDAAACKEACECSVDKCAASVDACLADAECSKVQDCAFGCACGDDECLLSCAKQTSSPLGVSVAECIASNCHVGSTLLGAPNLSCHGSACEASCKCAHTRCMGVGMTCLLDPHCSGFQSCSFNCACGDSECAIKCAEEQNSHKAMPLAECITQRCHQELNI